MFSIHIVVSEGTFNSGYINTTLTVVTGNQRLEKLTISLTKGYDVAQVAGFRSSDEQSFLVKH